MPQASKMTEGSNTELILRPRMMMFLKPSIAHAIGIRCPIAEKVGLGNSRGIHAPPNAEKTNMGINANTVAGSVDLAWTPISNPKVADQNAIITARRSCYGSRAENHQSRRRMFFSLYLECDCRHYQEHNHLNEKRHDRNHDQGNFGVFQTVPCRKSHQRRHPTLYSPYAGR